MSMCKALGSVPDTEQEAFKEGEICELESEDVSHGGVLA